MAFHNEKGFQPKDLYAMCQVGESSKQAGSGKIGRKGIGFKSTFQITDCPLIVSPPFSFCFDTAARGIFGYIVPSWVEQPEQHVPSRHQLVTPPNPPRRRRRRHAARVPVCVACTRHRSAARL